MFLLPPGFLPLLRLDLTLGLDPGALVVNLEGEGVGVTGCWSKGLSDGLGEKGRLEGLGLWLGPAEKGCPEGVGLGEKGASEGVGPWLLGEKGLLEGVGL